MAQLVSYISQLSFLSSFVGSDTLVSQKVPRTNSVTVDIFAPGSNIVSDVPGGSTEPLSGTSMASPHIAGLGAYFIALDGVSGGDVCNYIIDKANSGVGNPGSGTTDKLAYNDSGD